MRRTALACFVLLCLATPALAGTFSSQTLTSYDIDSNQITSYVGFSYSRDWWDTTLYEYDVTQVLQPWDWWPHTTLADGASWAQSVDAEAHQCYYTMLTIQQYDFYAGRAVGGYSDQSDTECAPERCMYTIWEDHAGSLLVNAAGYAPVGQTRWWYAGDYPDLVFDHWETDYFDSRDRYITVTLQSTSFSAMAHYVPSPPGCGAACNDGGNDGDASCNVPPCNVSPIVLNVGKGGWHLTGLDDPVAFDINATGTLRTMAWTARDAELGLLAIDLDGDEAITSGRELFGNRSILPTGAMAANGFQALAAYDTNGDGAVNRDDPVWSSLLLWVDRNHDGISQRDELSPLSAFGIGSLGTDAHWTGRRDIHGNQFRYEALCRTATSQEPYYDIFFVLKP